MTTTLTIEQAIALASVLNAPSKGSAGCNNKTTTCHDRIPVVVCTAMRGVVFGYTTNVNDDPIELTEARMCLRWSAQIGGVFGLAEKGPFDASKSGNTTISASVKSLALKEITAVFRCDDAAVTAWTAAPVAGR